LQCAAACCSVLQRNAVCCSGLPMLHQRVGFRSSRYTACWYAKCARLYSRVPTCVCCSVLQRGAACSSVFKCVVTDTKCSHLYSRVPTCVCCSDSVLQCVELFCHKRGVRAVVLARAHLRLLQRVAACCSVLHRVAMYGSITRWITLGCYEMAAIASAHILIEFVIFRRNLIEFVIFRRNGCNSMCPHPD